MRKWLQNPLFAAVFVGFLQASPAQDSDLYDTGTLRTLHLEFAQANWWDLLEANYDSGVDIPAQLTVEECSIQMLASTSRATPLTP